MRQESNRYLLPGLAPAPTRVPVIALRSTPRAVTDRLDKLMFGANRMLGIVAPAIALGVFSQINSSAKPLLAASTACDALPNRSVELCNTQVAGFPLMTLTVVVDVLRYSWHASKK